MGMKTWMILGAAAALLATTPAEGQDLDKANNTQRVHDIISEVGWSCVLSETGTDDTFWNYSMVSTVNITKDDVLTILYKINFDRKDLSYKAIHKKWEWVYDDIWYIVEMRMNSNLSEEEETEILKRFNPLAELKSMSDDELTQFCLPMS